MRRPWPTGGCCSKRKKKKGCMITILFRNIALECRGCYNSDTNCYLKFFKFLNPQRGVWFSDYWYSCYEKIVFQCSQNIILRAENILRHGCLCEHCIFSCYTVISALYVLRLYLHLKMNLFISIVLSTVLCLIQ